MKYLTIVFGVFIVLILMITLVSAGNYVAPSYTNVTIVLDSSYTSPNYTNVTIVLNEQTGVTNCWTKTSNIIYIPNGCLYQTLNGAQG
jgi:hypothetical protein